MRLTALVLPLALLPSLFPFKPPMPAGDRLVAGQFTQAEPAPKPAQSKQSQQKQDSQKNDEQVLRLSSRLVLVPVSASDVSGHPVRDLTISDIVIEEEGRPQSIVSLGEPGKAPVDLALLFDVSLSVQAQFAFEQEAATRFIKDVMKPIDSISIFSIGVMPKIVKPRTNSTDQAIRGVMSLNPSTEPTALFDSVAQAATYLGTDGDPSSRRVIVVISDGEENYSKEHTLDDALRDLQKNDCLFYAINPSTSAIELNKISMRGQKNLESMSAETGGKTFLPERLEDLQAVFRQIAEELQAQYLFGYYSTDERADGGFRRITVRAPKRSDLRVRARQGYYAPKS